MTEKKTTSKKNIDKNVDKKKSTKSASSKKTIENSSKEKDILNSSNIKKTLESKSNFSIKKNSVKKECDKEVIIEIKDLKKVYKGPPTASVLSGVNIDIYKNEIVSITGESGSGKTTLLNLIGGIDDITSGSINICGHNIELMKEHDLTTFRNKFIGYIFQFHNLLNEFTALENVMIAFLIKEYNKSLAKTKAIELLQQVGMGSRLHHQIGELSGGEAQRVAIARALINEPAIVLADEPTGNLDKKNASLIQELLWNLTRQRKATLIIVTHSQSIASLADRTIKMELDLNI